MAGFSGGFWEAGLQKKYDIQQQEANSGTTSAAATMMNAQSTRALNPAQIAAYNARAGFDVAQAGEVAPNAASTRDLNASNAELNRIRMTPEQTTAALFTGLQMDPQGRLVQRSGTTGGMISTDQSSGLSFGSGIGSLGDGIGSLTPTTQKRFGAAKGTAMVPGKGSGKVDTVPATLAPGEAVLNKAAAEGMGRGLIAALNAAGARKMGMV